MHTIKIEDGRRKWIWNIRKKPNQDRFIELLKRFAKQLIRNGEK